MKRKAFDVGFLLTGKENGLTKMLLRLWTCIDQKVEKIRAAATIRTLVIDKIYSVNAHRIIKCFKTTVY